jgi:hypothetical protein
MGEYRPHEPVGMPSGLPIKSVELVQPFRAPSGRMVRRAWPEMSLTLHHLLLRQLHRYCYPELTFAGGEGRAILATAKRLWRDYKPGSTHPSDYRPPLHSDGA